MIAERIGLSAEYIPLNDLKQAQSIESWLRDRYPQLADMTFRIAVDHVIGAQEIKVNSVIAVLPPFAGG